VHCNIVRKYDQYFQQSSRVLSFFYTNPQSFVLCFSSLFNSVMVSEPTMANETSANLGSSSSLQRDESTN
jgi:hypothetical protein